MSIDKVTMSGLIEGLPDSIALTCLARVPFYLYPTLELVSTTWRAALRSPDLYKVRQEVRSSEELFCLCASDPENVWQVYDPLRDRWITLPVLPSNVPLFTGFGTVSTFGKLFVLGGGSYEYDPLNGEIATNEVWSFDFITRRWTQRAPMLVPRAMFACCVMDGKIVVAGGFTSDKTSISQAEIYDPEKDEWVPIADLHQTHTSACVGLVIKGRVHVGHCGVSTVQILDPVKLDWTVEDCLWPQAPMAIVQDVLHILKNGLILRQEGESRKVVGSVSGLKSRVVIAMTGIGEEIYVIGGFDGPDICCWEICVDILTLDRPACRKVAPMSRCRGNLLGYTSIRI